MAGTDAAQLPPGFVDPEPVLRAAAEAIGTDNLKCVTIAGSGYAGAVGGLRLSVSFSSCVLLGLRAHFWMAGNQLPFPAACLT